MREHKNIANYLPTGAILFFVVIVVAFLLMPAPKKKFVLSQEEALLTILNGMNIIQPETIKEILDNQNQDYQFIDLRNPKDFELGHLPGAINIPVHELLNPENESVLNHKAKTNILYGNNVEDACAPYLILIQLNYNKNSIMLGGYKMIKSNVIDTYNPNDLWFRNEIAKYDYAAIIKQSSGGGAENNTTIKSAVPIIRQAKKKTVAGGC
ncbi:MAG: rhodanese-like domain-containing protein [Bacteroidota bacterium]